MLQVNVALPIAVPADSAELALNNFYEVFLNYHTGFTLHWPDYLAFAQTCSSQSGIPCDSLNYVLTLFESSPQYLQDSIGTNCRSAFAQFFNNYFHTFYSFSQIMDLFLQKCGSIPTLCSPQVSCTEFAGLIDQFYNNYGVTIYKNANCAAIFTAYFNLNKHTNYTFNQLDSIYARCGCSLDVCSFPNCFLLTRVLSAYQAQYGTRPWNNDNCESTFQAFFNTYFELPPDTYSIVDIYGFYDKCAATNCGPGKDAICQPPFSCKTLQTVVTLFYRKYGNGITKTGACRDSFVVFFNLQMHTHYTYGQIAAIYLQVCKEPLNVCDAVYSCSELITVSTYFRKYVPHTSDSCSLQFVGYFNQIYGTDLNYDKLKDLYVNTCGDLPNSCGDTIIITECIQLESFLQSLAKSHPDLVGEFGDSCSYYFTKLFNDHFGTDLAYQDIVNYYEVLCYKYLDVCQSNCDKFNELVTKMPQALCHDMKLPSIAASQLFIYYFKKQLDAAGLPAMEDNDVINNVIKGCPGTADCRSMVTDTLSANLSDPDVLQSLKLAYYLMHPDGLPTDCESDFTSWVNLCMGDSLDYKTLSGIYELIIGPGAGNICMEAADPVIVMQDTSTARHSFTGPMLCGLTEPVYPDVPLVSDPCSDIINSALGFAEEQFEYYLDSLRSVFDTAYMNKCLSVKNLETFTCKYSSSEYHYTLYYYDQAGNLVKTIPPEGVHPNYTATWLNTTVPNARNNGTLAVPSHTMATNYRYNTLNQVIAQSTPDADSSKFWYDRLGRLVVSQNAKQADLVNGIRYYSYTLYDQLGRITEVGEKPKASASPLMTQALSRNEPQLQGWIASASNLEKKEQITRTVYDDPWEPFCDGSDPAGSLLCQQNLRNRVSYTYVKTVDDNVIGHLWEAATFYSYDIHGNVDTLLQDYKTGMGAINCDINNSGGNRWKKMVYKYDLISGKVNEVAYQPGKVDQFYHQYGYDAENRLINVKTSRDHIYWENDASYTYYRHGPLARTVLGELQVQGLDYAYTLQGWLKGVNSTVVGDGTYDMGEDGKTGSVNSLVARDAYGFSLNYFSGDYAQINTAVNAFSAVSNNLPNPSSDNLHAGSDLFNGNIRAMLVNIPKLTNVNLYGYRYDQLNRIVAMNTYNGVSTASNTLINPSLASQDYNERITYDANGNILGYLRNGAQAVHGWDMDSLTYKYDYYTSANVRKTYIPGGAVPADAARLTNRLNYVKDIGGGTYTEDIKDQNGNNYTYDKIGNLTSDVKENISLIEWTVYGKISHILKTDGSYIDYTYDASGNRITKLFRSNGISKTTFYVRDASGNVMSIYESGETAINGGDLTQSEIHLYGSSRLGIYNVSTDVQCHTTTQEITTFIRGYKFFELSNHLGNVLVTVSDKRIAHNGSSGQIDYYKSDVLTANDYYPGGMQMPGRIYQQGSSYYRYGFNGKENDNEIIQYDYGFRIYDPRLVRFKSIDPLQKQYPYYTPYQFAGNSPIANVDLDGKEPKSVINELGQLTIPIIGFLSTALSIKESVLENSTWFIGNGNIIFEAAGQPNAITVGNKIYYSQERADRNQDSDVPHWVGLVGHEESHRQDYEEQGFVPFIYKYYKDNKNNKNEGMSDYSAYANIETEKKAFANQAVIEAFFNNPNNNKAFNDILNSKVYGQLEKSDRLKVVALDKIIIPQLEGNVKDLTKAMNNIDPTKDFLGKEKIEYLKSKIDTKKAEIANKKNEIKQLKTKIKQGDYQPLPGDH